MEMTDIVNLNLLNMKANKQLETPFISNRLNSHVCRPRSRTSNVLS